MSDALRVLLVGSEGRMGLAIQAAASAEEILKCGRGDSIDHRINDCDVVIDVSAAEATEKTCAACAANKKPLVLGTTGHSRAQTEVITQAANSIAVLHAPNFSIGVNTLFWLSRKVAELLGESFDLEIVETHHRLKKDAPSGTAKRLAEILAEARGVDQTKDIAHGREGLVGERPAKQIGMHSIRAGDVVGDHTVIFAAAGERLELTHKASSRKTFALGALRAARWILGKAPGLYSMENVLGL